jgi:formylglycine-generating enzyme required for sulfatase activity
LDIDDHLQDDQRAVVRVQLPPDERHAQGFRVAFGQNLVTNAEFSAAINRESRWRKPTGSYYLFNHCNPANPLEWSSDGTRLVVRTGFERHPVVGVTWFGARECARILGGRLPHANEWEHVSSGGGRHDYPWGDAPPSSELCNYGENVGSTTPVGSYPPGVTGLHDMSGNVGEWCLDSAAGFGIDAERIVKGGSWNRPAHELRSRHRRAKWGRMGTVSIGFRVVWDLE